MIKVFVAIPTTGTIVDSLPRFLRIVEERYKDKIEFIYPEHTVRRVFHDFARNGMVAEFMASKADVLWFIDSDVVPMLDCWDSLLKYYEEWDSAGCPYPVFITPPGEQFPRIVYTVYNNLGPNGYALAAVPPSGTDFVDAVGTGCMMLKRHVIEKIEAPHFSFKYDEKTRCITVGEDLSFCMKVNALGYKFFINYASVCSHHKTINLHDVSEYAQDYARRSVETYAASIKDAVGAFTAKRKSENFAKKILSVPGPR